MDLSFHGQIGPSQIIVPQYQIVPVIKSQGNEKLLQDENVKKYVIVDVKLNFPEFSKF